MPSRGRLAPHPVTTVSGRLEGAATGRAESWAGLAPPLFRHASPRGDPEPPALSSPRHGGGPQRPGTPPVLTG